MIVIPMAGNSQRFADAGYAVPKFMLPLAGRSLFAHAVGSFAAYFAAEPFLFIARADHDTRDFVAAEAAAMGIARWSTFLVPGPTQGQADTVRLGLDGSQAADDEPLTIFNIDTFRPGFRYPQRGWFGRADGYLEVMTSSDPGFSFVRPDSVGDQVVAETAEKRVMSDLASTGLYWFREAGLFRRAMAAGDLREGGELYVAPLYNRLIAQGCDIRYEQVATDQVIFCGIPAQYDALRDTTGNEGEQR